MAKKVALLVVVEFLLDKHTNNVSLFCPFSPLDDLVDLPGGRAKFFSHFPLRRSEANQGGKFALLGWTLAALNNSADSHLSIFLDAPIIPALFSRFVDLGCLHNDPLGLLRLWDF